MRTLHVAAIAGALTLTATAGWTQTVADVGDPESFGRTVKYLGARSTPMVYTSPVCQVPPPGLDRCVTLNMAGATNLDQVNLGTIRLPASASRTILCHSLSTYLNYEFRNTNSVRQQASLQLRPFVIIQSPVFNNPSIIDPTTGLPLNGQITVPLGLYAESRFIAPGEAESATRSYGRDCTGGIISRGGLAAFGLSSWQAAQVFAGPITVTLTAKGNSTLASRVGYQFGLRLFGD